MRKPPAAAPKTILRIPARIACAGVNARPNDLLATVGSMSSAQLKPPVTGSCTQPRFWADARSGTCCRKWGSSAASTLTYPAGVAIDDSVDNARSSTSEKSER
jgi:hypothetical protein